MPELNYISKSILVSSEYQNIFDIKILAKRKCVPTGFEYKNFRKQID